MVFRGGPGERCMYPNGMKELDPVTAELQTKLERLEALGWKTDQLQKDLSRMASLVGSRTLATLGVLGSATLTKSFAPWDEGSQLTRLCENRSVSKVQRPGGKPTDTGSSEKQQVEGCTGSQQKLWWN